MKSFTVTISPPKHIPAATRDALSQLLVRLGERFGLQGMEDWSVDISGSTRVLAVEREFHDLSSLRKESQNFVLYFAAKKRAGDFARLVAKSMPELKLGKVAPAKEVDWVKRWRKYYKPVAIRANGHSPRLWILPAWKKRKLAADELMLKIDPGQAFGTGTHPTTQLCLEYFLGLTHRTWGSQKKLKLLDFGAGTGILAMGALAWGRGTKRTIKATCVEIDPVAREQLRKNLRLNGMRAAVAAKIPVGTFDIVFANVLAPVLLAERKRLWAALKPGGILILSGLLAREAHVFLHDFLPAKGKRQLSLHVQGDWAAVLVQKRF